MTPAEQPVARRSLPSWITLIALYALAGLQVALVFFFWTSFDTLVDWVRWVLCGVGAGLAVVEIFALVVASEAADRGEKTKALAYRVVFFALALLNATAEIGAVATLTAGDQARRAGVAQAYAGAVAAKNEADAEIVRLRGILEAAGTNRPSAALRAEMEAAQRIRDGYAAQGLTAPWRIVENAARLESAYATVRELGRQTQARAAAQVRIDRAGGAPSSAHPQFEALTTVAKATGVTTNPDQVRAWLAFALAAVMKLVLAVGFWAVTPAHVRPAYSPPPPELAPLVTERIAGESTAGSPPARLVDRRKRRAQKAADAEELHEALDEIDSAGA